MDSVLFDRLLAEAALEMAQMPSTPTTLERAIVLATDLVESCDAAAISLFEENRPTTVAVSEETIREPLEYQFQVAAGPTMWAFAQREAVYCPDLATDARWSEFGRLISRQVGLNCAYAVPLAVREKPLGVLALYGKRSDGFGEDDLAAADVVATHAAIALADSLHQEHLHTALSSRTIIGQATGMVMERWGLDASTAFGVLRRLSQAQNVKVRDIANQIVETGTIPQ